MSGDGLGAKWGVNQAGYEGLRGQSIAFGVKPPQIGNVPGRISAASPPITAVNSVLLTEQ
jgi:hypothetical protein